MPKQSISDFLKPSFNTTETSSTSVHDNIDSLILQHELDKQQFGGVSYYRGRQEAPIDMSAYADLMSVANIPNAISNLAPRHTSEPEETLRNLSQDVINRMRLGDSPGGIIGYRATHSPGWKGAYYDAKNPLYAPDTIRIFDPPPNTPYRVKVGSDYQAETLLHEPLHAIRLEGGGNERGILHKQEKGFTQEDFDEYEQTMLKSLIDYFGSGKKAIKEANKVLGKQINQDFPKSYYRRVSTYNPMKDFQIQKTPKR